MVIRKGAELVKKSRQTRRPQARTEKARSSMISVATSMFAEKGYDATSIRNVEVKANVKRGMLIYHFGTKRKFWQEVVDSIWSIVRSKREDHISLLNSLEPLEGIEWLISFHVRFAAEFPIMPRLISNEAAQNSWRTEYIVNTHMRPGVEAMKPFVTGALHLSDEEFAHWYYILITASASIFSREYESKNLFGFDCREESVILAHTKTLTDMLMNGYDLNRNTDIFTESC
jgi:AcrR family transcriptional regulator